MSAFRKNLLFWVSAGACITMMASPAVAGTKKVTLNGVKEIPVVITDGSGTLSATISDDETTVDYKLTYKDVVGDVLQAHIHLGQNFATGPIVLFLCSNLAPPAGVPAPPACPTPSGTVQGTLTSANVIPAPAQGVSAGDLAAMIDAMRAGVAYVNVHTSVSPMGHIRGQFISN